jgi:hypothetical protein
MLSQPTPKISISITPTSVIWNGKNCPIIFVSSPNGSLKGLTFFDDAHAEEAKRILDSGAALESVYEISPVKGSLQTAGKENLEQEYGTMFMMQVAKLHNRIVGYIDVPEIWLKREDKISVISLDTPEFNSLIKPDKAELEAQIPKIVIKPKVPPSSILKDEDEETETATPEVSAESADNKAKKKGKAAKVSKPKKEKKKSKKKS